MVSGNLSNPRPSGQLESFVIRAPNSSASFIEYVYAVKAIDEVGNTSPISNILKVEFYQYKAKPPTPPNNTGYIIGGVVGILLAVVLVVLILSVIFNRKRKSQTFPIAKHHLSMPHGKDVTFSKY